MEKEEYLEISINGVKCNISRALISNIGMNSSTTDDNIIPAFILMDNDINYIENALSKWDNNSIIEEFHNFNLEICENCNIKVIYDIYQDYLLRLKGILESIDIDIYLNNENEFIFITRIINRVSILGWMCDTLCRMYADTKFINKWYIEFFKEAFNSEFSYLLEIIRIKGDVGAAFTEFVKRKLLDE